MAGHIQDRWFKTEISTTGKTVRTKTDRHGTGLRYRARCIGPDATEKSQIFPDGKKRLAEKWLTKIEPIWTVADTSIPEQAGAHSGATRRAERAVPASSYRRVIFASVSAVFTVAVEDDHLHRNPCKASTYPGHTDTGFTLRVYTHLLPSSEGRSRRAVDSVFQRPGSAPDGPQTAQG
ncbi:hypothetical protein [Streptomyces sp. NPDC058308]|uniref:hypothetical protein n=1 Tax=Streptomyces sp. NPDC058308 TaxID=3346440 RepID=UPI0036E40FB4